ncbi:MAG: two-component regulator propeller domain-containing protein [Bacteroidales bacterium]|nr:two-component regulator propeller domain-containing protein [Bacteroidales bacterium]
MKPLKAQTIYMNPFNLHFKREHNIVFIITILFLLNNVHCVFSNDNIYFRHYTNKEGLSHNTVYCSVQDKQGFMWFGTEDGLNRFDGKNFRLFPTLTEEEKINSKREKIISLLEDSEERLWVCSESKTGFFDKTRNTFTEIKLSNSSKNYWAYQLKEDENKNLWMIANEELIKYGMYDGKTRFYGKDLKAKIKALNVSSKGAVWIASNDSLYRYINERDKFSGIAINSENKQLRYNITCIYPVTDLGIFIGTADRGLLLYSLNSSSTEEIIPDIMVREILPMNNNDYWIATENGLYIYNIISKKTSHFEKSLVNPYALSDNAIYALSQDKEGGMWICTFFGGINYMPKEYSHFDKYIAGITDSEMKGNVVRKICADKNGNLWVGTEDNGVNMFNQKKHTTINFSANNNTNHISATNIHALMVDDDKLWMGSFNTGIDVMDINTHKIIKRYHSKDGKSFLNSDFVLSIFKTSDNEILIGTAAGVQIYDKKDDRFYIWKGINLPTKEIIEDSRGDIWIATLGGIIRYNKNGTSSKKKKNYNEDNVVTMSGMILHTEATYEDNVINYSFNPADSTTVGTNEITSIFEDSKGQMWILTTNGMYSFNSERETFTPVFNDSYIPSKLLYSMLEDNENNFWISSARGLIKYNRNTKEIKFFGYKDNLHETQFNFNSSYKDEEGEMYFGTINGMISFLPHQFKEDTFEPKLFFTELSFNSDDNTDTYALNNNDLNLEYLNEIKLPYNKSSFSVGFVAISYTLPEGIRYSYKIEGISDEWNDLNSENNVNFYNLSPGKYNLYIRSTNSSGVWQNNEKCLKIRITPPYWQSNIAYFLYAIAIILIAINFYYYKKRKYAEIHNQKMILFESQKETELYNAKIKFFTFITHEIRTPLTLIKAPLEKILNSNNLNAQIKENLECIQRNTKRLLELSNQLLDFGKTENNGYKLCFIKTDLKALIQETIEPFYDTIYNQNKDIKVNLPDGELLASVDSEIIRKIVNNLISNAVKYSAKNISLELYSKDSDFFVKVSNDGSIIPTEERQKIFEPFYRLSNNENILGSGIGLSIVNTLAEFHKGSIVYSDENPEMNCFVFKAPLNQKESFILNNIQEIFENNNISILEPPVDGRHIIMIVEDQQEMLSFISKELKQWYSVVEVSNGAQALEYLSKQSVHLIISDIMMPVMNGMELCLKVKNDVNLQHIPFIMLTAQHNEKSFLEGLDKGADAYLMKPFSMDILHAQIENLIKSREQLNRAYLERPFTQSIHSSNKLDTQFIDKLNSILEDRLSDSDYSIEELASDIGLSSSSLYRKIKTVSGLSPVEFIKQARLKKAVLLMEEGENRINEIAMQTGFSSSSYFSTCFQKHYGITPSECIKNKKDGKTLNKLE